jgi:hypothetical protein
MEEEVERKPFHTLEDAYVRIGMSIDMVKFMFKCGLGVWMGKRGSWRQEVGARKLGTW